jgi:hypothetical protein
MEMNFYHDIDNGEYNDFTYNDNKNKDYFNNNNQSYADEHNLEYDNYYHDNNTTETVENYWEPVKPIKKKRVTFPDILSNMNLVVKNGVLQQMGPAIPQTKHDQYTDNYNNDNNYIYNKYFKDYATMNQSNYTEIKVPKTLEEYKKMLLEEKAKRFLERRRIAQIKSTKLLFTDSGVQNNNIIKPSVNNLRKMYFS